MAAGVHRAGDGGGEVQPRFLVHRQRVHVAAQQHGAGIAALTGAPAAQDRDEAGGRLAVVDLQRQADQRGLELLGRARAVVADLRLGMDRAAQRDDVRQFPGADGGPVGAAVDRCGHGECSFEFRP